MAPTEASLEALDRLRDLSNPQWYIIPLLVIIMYIYAVEVKKARETGNWNVIFAGLTVLGMDLINEIWNALVFTFTNFSAFWTTPGETAFLILIGWNIEIAFMFSIAGIVFAKFLPPDKNEKINLKVIKIPNRWGFAAGFAAFAVFVEVLLNQAGALVWVYPWWEATPWGIILIFLIGYFHFFVAAFLVHDLDDKRKQIKAVGVLYLIGIVALAIFIPLGWI